MRIISHKIVILIFAAVAGILLGSFVDNATVLSVVQVLKSVTSQVIFFLVPLIVLAFVSSSVTSLKSNATHLFLFAFLVAYFSSEVSAILSMAVSYVAVPMLHCDVVSPSRQLPPLVFSFAIPPLMNVISSLFLGIFLGLGVVWTKAVNIGALLNEFREVMLAVVKKVLLPILPLYIASNFYIMAWQGSVDNMLIFLPIIAIVIGLHLVWILLLYTVASLYSRRNAFEVLSHYMPAYFTALGTMSSAATLGVSLDCARKSKLLKREVSDFSIPLFANIHLSGATITETFFLSVVSLVVYGQQPEFSTFLFFIVLLGVFAVGAPGVPGGTAFATVGIVSSILGFDDNGIALFLALFALQDSFGTGCNILGDGALSLIVQTYNERHSKQS